MQKKKKRKGAGKRYFIEEKEKEGAGKHYYIAEKEKERSRKAILYRRKRKGKGQGSNILAADNNISLRGEQSYDELFSRKNFAKISIVTQCVLPYFHHSFCRSRKIDFRENTKVYIFAPCLVGQIFLISTKCWQHFSLILS